MKTRAMYPLTLAVAAAVLLAANSPLRASETDERIESSFRNTYAYKTYLKDEQIKISSKDGAVTLSGSVADETHKSMAQDVAEALPGVKSVDNRIEIQGDRPAEKSDTWISMKVKSALLFHRNVNAHGTEVYVKDGIVTLKGEASSQAQKQLTTEYAEDVEGVKEVKNQMTVAKTSKKTDETVGETIDNGSITAQVKVALITHRSTSAMHTTVDTKDGVVTLGGKAKNEAEKDLVTKLVSDIHGVKSVVNNMTIEETESKN